MPPSCRAPSGSMKSKCTMSSTPNFLRDITWSCKSTPAVVRNKASNTAKERETRKAEGRKAGRQEGRKEGRQAGRQARQVGRQAGQREGGRE